MPTRNVRPSNFVGERAGSQLIFMHRNYPLSGIPDSGYLKDTIGLARFVCEMLGTKMNFNFIATSYRIIRWNTKVTCISLRHFSTGDKDVGNHEPVFESRVEVPLVPPRHNASIAVINLNDCQTKNALSKNSVFKFLDILNRLQLEQIESNQVRALIVRSTVPNIFCAGANLKERITMSKIQVESWLRIQRSLMDNLSDFPYPTIAAIDGHALGGGLELALACDIRIVHEKAKVGLVETKLAIIPGAGGTQRLTRLIGVGRAKEHIFVAEPIDGVEATRIGISNHLASGQNGAFNKAIELASKICKRGPRALKLAKSAIDNGSQTSLDTGLDIENAYYGQLLDSADRTEGMKAFTEKREPFYTGE